MFKKISLPIQLLLVIAFAFLLGDYCPLWFMRLAFSLSSLFRMLLGLILPLMVFSFIATGCLALKRNAPLLIGTMLLCVVGSNALVAFLTYWCTQLCLPALTCGISVNSTMLDTTCLSAYPLVSYVNDMLSAVSTFCAQIPLVNWFIPLRAEFAMVSAMILGIGLPLLSRVFKHNAIVDTVTNALFALKRVVERMLMQFFIPLLPVYVLGFLLELNYRNVTWSLFEYYGRTFAFMIALHLIYLGLMYLVVNGFSITEMVRTVKNALPSYLTAMSTMSSTATVPVTVIAGEKNTHNRPLVDIAAPILANVHLVGDAISVPVLALVTIYLFLGITVPVLTFTRFIVYFCMAMLAVSGVPGGGIMVMIPILEKILGFTPEMISLITALYVLQDAFGTAANVMGDGALMIMLNKIVGKRTTHKG